MKNDALQTFAETLTPTWGPLTSEGVATAHAAMSALLRTPPTEPWLAAVHAEASESRELYRDETHDFRLLAHVEPTGRYRPPHDHGRGWVVYGVQQGEMEMSTYRRVHDLDGSTRLVKRESYVLRAGDVRVFLPGDIHDTRCTAGPLTYFRLTSRDLKREDVTRYPAPGLATCAARPR